MNMAPVTSTAEIQRMRDRIATREKSRRVALDQRLAQAQRDFERIAAHIWKTYGPTQIWQWGSLISGQGFWERSDIDIGVEGVLQAEECFAILRDIEKMSRFPVDLVQMEKIHPVYAEFIREHGRVVYER